MDPDQSDESQPLLQEDTHHCDDKPLLNHASGSVNRSEIPVAYQTYRTRWYVLFVFVMLAMSQLCLWITWGTIADTGRFANRNISHDKLNFTW